MTFSTQHAPPDQPLLPSVAESEASFIRLSWDSPARCNSLPIQGLVLECLVIDDKEAHERCSIEVQDIWKGCMRIEVRESEPSLYHLRPNTTVWARVAAFNAKGQGVFSASAIFPTSQDEPTEYAHMCVPEEHAQEATMEHRDMLVEMLPKSSPKDNQVLTPVSAPQVHVINVPVETPRVPSPRRPTCLVLLNQQTKCRKHAYQKEIVHKWPRVQILLGKRTHQSYVIPELKYGLVWQDICKEESQEDADGKFTRVAIMCETGHESLTASQL